MKFCGWGEGRVPKSHTKRRFWGGGRGDERVKYAASLEEPVPDSSEIPQKWLKSGLSDLFFFIAT